MTDGEEAPQVVGSVGPLDAIVVLLREYLHRSGALRAAAVVAGEPGEPPSVVDCSRFEPIEVETGGETVVLAHGAELSVEPPVLPEMRRWPPFDVDAGAAQIAAPPGAVADVAASVRELAGRLGGRNVAMAQFETTDPEAPLAITARAGGEEPLVLTIGEEEFEMAPGWP